MWQDDWRNFVCWFGDHTQWCWAGRVVLSQGLLLTVLKDHLWGSLGKLAVMGSTWTCWPNKASTSPTVLSLMLHWQKLFFKEKFSQVCSRMYLVRMINLRLKGELTVTGGNFRMFFEIPTISYTHCTNSMFSWIITTSLELTMLSPSH